MTLLQVENLSIDLHTDKGPLEIVGRIDFSLRAGERIGIVGESGCGKSITALALLSLLPPGFRAGGSIALAGQDINGLNSRQICAIRGSRIGMIFQEPMTALNPLKTIGNQIRESIDLHRKLKRRQTLVRVCELMEKVGLPTQRFPLHLYPHQLSGGQRQRVMIAMAIACAPDILIADEPTSALDVAVQRQILELIRELADSAGMAVVLISHNLGVVAQIAENVMVMYAGSIVEKGTVADIFHNMSHPYTYGLFSALPHLGSSVETARKRLRTIPGRVPEPHARCRGCNFANRCFKATKTCEREKPAAVKLSACHTVWCHHPLSGEEKK